jgi:hypothetical protein
VGAGEDRCTGPRRAQVGFPEAKYMLVSCTAFINYLLELARLGGIALGPNR